MVRLTFPEDQETCCHGRNRLAWCWNSLLRNRRRILKTVNAQGVAETARSAISERFRVQCQAVLRPTIAFSSGWLLNVAQSRTAAGLVYAGAPALSPKTPSSDFRFFTAFIQAEVMRDLMPHRLLDQLRQLRARVSRAFVWSLVDRNFVWENESFTDTSMN
jgi:hypothetical protein